VPCLSSRWFAGEYETARIVHGLFSAPPGISNRTITKRDCAWPLPRPRSNRWEAMPWTVAGPRCKLLPLYPLLLAFGSDR
jgi:hypothetical protein